MKNISRLTLILSGISLSLPVMANEYVQHDAHVHGQVEYNIAQEGKELMLAITAPGADVVGFEHSPQNNDQEQILAEAIKSLEKADNLVMWNQEANCQINNVEFIDLIQSNETGDHDDHHHDNHHNHHDDHHHDDHHHDDHNHDHHDDHHDDHHHDHNSHGEFIIEYQYTCANPENLNSMSTNWFNDYPSTELINVNVFTDKVQSRFELTASNNTLSLR